jgi:hypothetical protein
MNGTISLLHKGGITDDKPQDWRVSWSRANQGGDRAEAQISI